ncbi:hypothetical protein TSAR_007737 [Trichomalopsis sarcophagae]|uniref:Endonuclease/exonuclease/phosphatase domain-containing protein n=1 Tax=Trichomalopsis sarcophagae TaxID=543379 RepID=A0A232EJP6_9HYME|nr:hypothetical protein TSAR_007737 [Trichomalopsis sarcophagae]
MTIKNTNKDTEISWGEESTNEMITAKIGRGEKEKEGKIIVGGDFNARTAETGGRKPKTEDKEESRKSKDKYINEEGKYMIEKLEETGMHIVNGDIEGDWEGEWTYLGGNGCSTIDYIITNEEGRETIERMIIGGKWKPDHFPVEEQKKNKRTGEGWWDKECMEAKTKVKEALRNWKEGREDKEEFMIERSKYRQLIEKKERGGRKEKEWEEHFRKLLDGRNIEEREKERKVWKEQEKKEIREKKREEEREQEKEITHEEIKEAIRKLKKKKAAGEDEIQNEAWIFGGDRVEDFLYNILNSI